MSHSADAVFPFVVEKNLGSGWKLVDRFVSLEIAEAIVRIMQSVEDSEFRIVVVPE